MNSLYSEKREKYNGKEIVNYLISLSFVKQNVIVDIPLSDFRLLSIARNNRGDNSFQPLWPSIFFLLAFKETDYSHFFLVFVERTRYVFILFVNGVTFF